MISKIVCIDAGHYGKYNRCPNNSKYYESEVMWKIHLLQKKYLEQLGIKVILTRGDQSKDLTLGTRGKLSEGCDLFISNHTNAVGSGMNEKVDYVAVYHLVNDTTTKCDNVSKEIAQKLAPIIAEVMGTKQGYKVLSRKSDNDKNKDGMLNDNYYGVLNGARSVGIPALIIEHSFHTNTRTVKWLLVDSNLDKLARAEAECIASYLLGKKVTLNTSTTTTTVSSFKVKVKVDGLNIRKGPGTSYAKVGCITDKGVYTIVETNGNWGKLKSGAGWINISDKYVTKK